MRNQLLAHNPVVGGLKTQFENGGQQTSGDITRYNRTVRASSSEGCQLQVGSAPNSFAASSFARQLTIGPKSLSCVVCGWVVLLQFLTPAALSEAPMKNLSHLQIHQIRSTIQMHAMDRSRRDRKLLDAACQGSHSCYSNFVHLTHHLAGFTMPAERLLTVLLFRDDFRLPGYDGQAKERKRRDDKWKLQERSLFTEEDASTTHHHGRPSSPASTEQHGESPTSDAVDTLAAAVAAAAAATAAASPAGGIVELLAILRAQHEEHQASSQLQQAISQAQHAEHTAEMAKLRTLILTLKR